MGPEIIPFITLAMEESFQCVACLALFPPISRRQWAPIRVQWPIHALVHKIAFVHHPLPVPSRDSLKFLLVFNREIVDSGNLT